MDNLHDLIDEHVEDTDLAYRLHDRVGLCEANVVDATFEQLVDYGSPTPCDDCGMDVVPHDDAGRRLADEWYAVTDELWAAASPAGSQPPRYLCVGCLEKRIGRRLTPTDFPDLGINDPEGWHSDRLSDRLGVG